MAVSDRVAALYEDQYAGGQERAWRDAGARDKAANIRRIWQDQRLERPRVVEIGCGEGAVAHALSRLDFFCAYRGFDLSPSGVAEARGRKVPGATFEHVSGEAIPVADDDADLVVMSHVVEHLENPRQLVAEAARIAPYIAVEVPLELHLRSPKDYVWSSLGHINHYNATSIRHFLQTCDLTVVDQFTTNPSQDVHTFGTTSWRRRASWRAKEASLRLAPQVGRQLFTFHETLLVRRNAGRDG